MQQAVLHHFPDAQSTYNFTHRDANIYFTRQCYEQFAAAIPREHSFLLLLLFLFADKLDARVLRPVFDALGTYLATRYVPVFQTVVPRLLGRLSLQAISGPSVLRATRLRQ